MQGFCCSWYYFVLGGFWGIFPRSFKTLMALNVEPSNLERPYANPLPTATAYCLTQLQAFNPILEFVIWCLEFTSCAVAGINFASLVGPSRPEVKKQNLATCRYLIQFWNLLFGAWNLLRVQWLGLTSLRSLDPAVPRSKSKTSQPAVAGFCFLI